MINNIVPYFEEPFTEFELLSNIYTLLFIWFFLWLCFKIFTFLSKKMFK